MTAQPVMNQGLQLLQAEVSLLQAFSLIAHLGDLLLQLAQRRQHRLRLLGHRGSKRPQSVGVAVLLGLALVIQYFVSDHNPPSGFYMTAMVIMGFSSLNLITLGIMGEYIARIYGEVKDRPLYLLRDERSTLELRSAEDRQSAPSQPDREPTGVSGRKLAATAP